MHDLVMPEEYLLLEGDTPGHRVVLIGSEAMGEGDEILGRKLMLALIGEMSSGPILPHAIILYNGGVRLASADSPVLADLKELEHHGTDVMVCAASLEHFGIPSPLTAGRPVSLPEMSDCLMKASAVIRP